jgi:hypothetical protein
LKVFLRIARPVRVGHQQDPTPRGAPCLTS